MVAAARRGSDLQVYDNKCSVEVRERQHDPVFFEWSCTIRRNTLTVSNLVPAWTRATRPRVEPSSTSEHARNAAQHGCADQETDEPVHDQETDQTDRAWNPAVLQSTLQALRSIDVRNRRQMSPCTIRRRNQTDRARNPTVLQSTLKALRSMPGGELKHCKLLPAYGPGQGPGKAEKNA